jgi:hypothetical protein
MARKSTRRQPPSKKRQRTKARKATPRQPPLMTTGELERLPAPPSPTAAQTEVMLRLVLEAKQAAETQLERKMDELTAPGTIGFWASGRGDLDSAGRFVEAVKQMRMENTKATIRARMKTPVEPRRLADIPDDEVTAFIKTLTQAPLRSRSWLVRRLKERFKLTEHEKTTDEQVKARGLHPRPLAP